MKLTIDKDKDEASLIHKFDLEDLLIQIPSGLLIKHLDCRLTSEEIVEAFMITQCDLDISFSDREILEAVRDKCLTADVIENASTVILFKELKKRDNVISFMNFKDYSLKEKKQVICDMFDVNIYHTFEDLKDKLKEILK